MTPSPSDPVTVLHNTACSTSRSALDATEQAGVDTTVVQYLKHPLSRDELLDLLGKLEDPPADLVRKDGFFTQLGLDAADFVSPEAVADLLTEHPQMGLTDVYAAVLPKLKFNPGLHVFYEETVLRIPDGKPKQKDVPAELGGSGALLAD